MSTHRYRRQKLHFGYWNTTLSTHLYLTIGFIIHLSVTGKWIILLRMLHCLIVYAGGFPLTPFSIASKIDYNAVCSNVDYIKADCLISSLLYNQSLQHRDVWTVVYTMKLCSNPEQPTNIYLLIGAIRENKGINITNTPKDLKYPNQQKIIQCNVCTGNVIEVPVKMVSSAKVYWKCYKGTEQSLKQDVENTSYLVSM